MNAIIRVLFMDDTEQDAPPLGWSEPNAMLIKYHVSNLSELYDWLARQVVLRRKVSRMVEDRQSRKAMRAQIYMRFIGVGGDTTATTSLKLMIMPWQHDSGTLFKNRDRNFRSWWKRAVAKGWLEYKDCQVSTAKRVIGSQYWIIAIQQLCGMSEAEANAHFEAMNRQTSLDLVKFALKLQS